MAAVAAETDVSLTTLSEQGVEGERKEKASPKTIETTTNDTSQDTNSVSARLEDTFSYPKSKVVPPPIVHPTITTWQWLFAASDMPCTPSILHSGITEEQERYSRWKGVQLIFRIGDYMRVGNHVMNTASIFFHRFYMRRALPKDPRERLLDTFNFQEMAPTCIFLACKVQETPRKLPSVIEATMAVLDRSPRGIELTEARSFKADVESKEYRRWKDLVLLYEERLLETLCFDLIIDQPHPTAIKACKRLGTSRDIAQLTVILLNSLLHGAVCTFFDGPTLAACAFRKACSLAEIDPVSFLEHSSNSTRSWFDAFDVEAEEVEDAMADVEEYLTYHNERLQSGQHAAKTYIAAPTPAQQTPVVLREGGQGGTITPSVSASGEVQPKQLHFSTQDTIFAPPQEEEESGALDSMGLSRSSPKVVSNIDQVGEGSAVQREERTNAIRPISRHGSKGADLGPPPPLSMSDPTKVQKEVNDQSTDMSEAAALQKISHEQSQQEESAAPQSEEEEGAL